MAAFKDITNQRFGRLIAIRSTGKRKSGQVVWKCICNCGSNTLVSSGNLRSGNTKSCGCTHGESHGMHGISEYNAWISAKGRCTNPNNAAFKHYGQRKIKMCNQWLSSFSTFFKDMGQRPKGMTLDRIDNDGPYSPENCRWASWETQLNNKRTTLHITLSGQTKSISEWSKIVGISKNRIWRRINELGWSHEKAVTTPLKRIDA